MQTYLYRLVNSQPPSPKAVGRASIFLILIVYSRVVGYDYINYDDLNWIDVAQTSGNATSIQLLVSIVLKVVNSNWCPLTNLSFAIETHFLGANPVYTHVIEVLLHGTNTWLLYRFLSRTLGPGWQSATATLLFAVHPMNVEAVAWVSDRKGLLSATFLLMMLTQYVKYVENPSFRGYIKTLSLFLLSLAAKPSAVTVPILLLLLDLWPLNRFDPQRRVVWRLFTEKVPFLLLAVSDGFLVYKAQHNSGGIAHHSFSANFDTALVGCARYVCNFVCPIDLNVCYYHPGSWSILTVRSAFLLLAGITLMTIWSQKNKQLLVCWLAFLVSIGPVLELVPLGHCYMADRYVYLPYIWLSLFVCNVLSGYARPPSAVLPVAVVVIVWMLALTVDSFQQVATWRDSVSVFSRAVEVDSANPIAHGNLALGYRAEGMHEKATAHAEASLHILPNDPFALELTGRVYQAAGVKDMALWCFRKAYRVCSAPRYMIPYARLLAMSQSETNPTEALRVSRLAVIAAPSFDSWHCYAMSLRACGDSERADLAERKAQLLAGRKESLFRTAKVEVLKLDSDQRIDTNESQLP